MYGMTDTSRCTVICGELRIIHPYFFYSLWYMKHLVLCLCCLMVNCTFSHALTVLISCITAISMILGKSRIGATLPVVWTKA